MTLTSKNRIENLFEKSRVRSKSLQWPAPHFKAPNKNRFLNLHKAQVAGDDFFPGGDLTSSENESEVTDEIPEGFTEAQMDELELKKNLENISGAYIFDSKLYFFFDQNL